MPDERLKRWQVRIPEQVLCVTETEREGEVKVASLLASTTISFQVEPRYHCPEQCWCGDDHSP